MCSVGDDFENDGEKLMLTVEKSYLSELKCNKCKESQPKVLLRGKDAYCKCCFLANCTHKFKALLGKSKLIRPNDRVLVSYEVGQPITALLHFLRNGLDLNTPKKLRFDPVIVFLEDQYHLTVEERNNMMEKVAHQVKSLKFQIHFVSFADSVSNDRVLISESSPTVGDSDGQIISNIIAKNASKTAKKEIVNILRKNTLISIARKMNCKFVFTPEISVDIASNLLTNVSLGRGSQIPTDTGFCDDSEAIKIIRPLRLFDVKEITFYNIFNNLDPIHIRQDNANPYSSVQDLLKKFVTDLQENYPSTVTTIMKTGDKLAIDNKQVMKSCKLCKGIIPVKSKELNSEESTKFSALVSNELPDHTLSSTERYTKIIEKFNDLLVPENTDYCYSCSKISDYIISDI